MVNKNNWQKPKLLKYKVNDILSNIKVYASAYGCNDGSISGGRTDNHTENRTSRKSDNDENSINYLLNLLE